MKPVSKNEIGADTARTAITFSVSPRSDENSSEANASIGWKDDSLQRVMDSPCYVNCPVLKEQTIEEANKCSVKNNIDEDIDGCELSRNSFE